MKIPKGQSESVNLRRIDNTIANRKRTNNDLQNITQKTTDRATRTPLKTNHGPFIIAELTDKWQFVYFPAQTYPKFFYHNTQAKFEFV